MKGLIALVGSSLVKQGVINHSSIPVVLFCFFFFPQIVQGGENLTIKSFENSAFFLNYKIKNKDSWQLKSGGRCFYYSYPDPDNPDSGFSLELSNDPSNIRKLGIVWRGLSLSEPATFTPKRQKFLKDLTLTVEPKVDPSPMVIYVKNQQKMDYPGGGDTMPRKKIGPFSFSAGIVGPDLVVIMDR